MLRCSMDTLLDNKNNRLHSRDGTCRASRTQIRPNFVIPAYRVEIDDADKKFVKRTSLRTRYPLSRSHQLVYFSLTQLADKQIAKHLKGNLRDDYEELDDSLNNAIIKTKTFLCRSFVSESDLFFVLDRFVALCLSILDRSINTESRQAGCTVRHTAHSQAGDPRIIMSPAHMLHMQRRRRPRTFYTSIQSLLQEIRDTRA